MTFKTDETWNSKTSSERINKALEFVNSELKLCNTIHPRGYVPVTRPA